MEVLWEIHDKWTFAINHLQTDVILNSGEMCLSGKKKTVPSYWWKKFASGEHAKPLLWGMPMSVS